MSADTKGQKYRPADDPRPVFDYFFGENAEWLGTELATQAAEAQGTYAIKHGEKLKIISMNSVYCTLSASFALRTAHAFLQAVSSAANYLTTRS